MVRSFGSGVVEMKDISEVQKPAVVKRKVSEAQLQERCVRWARITGWWARKFSSPSQRSVPDYLFAKGETKFACEFKRPGTKPKLIKRFGVVVMSTEAQYEEQVRMRQAGWFVFECDNFEEFTKYVEVLIHKYRCIVI